MPIPFEERLWDSYAKNGREWRYRIYFYVAYVNDWWIYASSLECWTVRVAAMLGATLAGLVLAYKIRGG